jgi:outer membrane protein with beta-barrel domain
MGSWSQLQFLFRGAVLFVAWAALAVPHASAQEIEASVQGGYTFSEGIVASEQRQILGLRYDSLDVTSGGSFGFTIGAFVGPNFELEFLWDRQFSTVQISNPAPDLTLADQNVDNYHGNFVYNWGELDAKVRPFFFGGLRATHYSPGDYDAGIPNGASLARISSHTKFSSTWGGGVKVYASPHVGIKGTARWTPTYIKSDSGGVWCDPFYPTCWVLADPDYSNQFQFSGGVTFRFGGR